MGGDWTVGTGVRSSSAQSSGERIVGGGDLSFVHNRFVISVWLVQDAAVMEESSREGAGRYRASLGWEAVSDRDRSGVMLTRAELAVQYAHRTWSHFRPFRTDTILLPPLRCFLESESRHRRQRGAGRPVASERLRGAAAL